MSVGAILKEELKKISLTKEEEEILKEKANRVVEFLKKNGFEAFIGGSLAKGTVIKKKTQDIDIFVVFRDEKEIDKLSRLLDKSDMDIKKIHGSRDYFNILDDGTILELIPVVSFDEPAEAKNVTDFSLLHVKYIAKKLNKNKLGGEIKLAKTFCHAQNVYGAESYIKGFSGYALELLVVHYGSFLAFLKAMVKVKGQIVIDPEKKFKGNALKELNESKLQSPLVLIDPTYKFRNVTAGLSKETFEKFVESAKNFLKKPSLSFFETKEVSESALEKLAKGKKARLVKLGFSTDRQGGDIAATKMKKFFDFACKDLERKEQNIIESAFVYNQGQEAIGYIVIKENKEFEMKGPPKAMKEAVSEFKRVNKKVYEKGGFVFTKKKVTLKEIFSHLHRFEKEMGVKFNFLDSAL